ncbi:hypothetical protein FOWG_16952 [Fusarium oxysporum f. sp. lycopersici MN25]|nr:hypothetical protein FOWG_16952 [Fusarium oxysporum f. sp. lycopersici MN25]
MLLHEKLLQERFDILTHSDLHLLQQTYRKAPHLFVQTCYSSSNQHNATGPFHTSVEDELGQAVIPSITEEVGIEQLSEYFKNLGPDKRKCRLYRVEQKTKEFEQRLEYLYRKKLLHQVALAIIKASAGKESGTLVSDVAKLYGYPRHVTDSLRKGIYIGERWLTIFNHAEALFPEVKRVSLGLLYALSSSRSKLEGSVQAKVPGVLKELWDSNVVSAATGASEYAKTSLCNILDYPTQISVRALPNNGNSPPIMGEYEKAVEGAPVSSRHANTLLTPPSENFTNFGTAPSRIPQRDLDSLYTLLCFLADAEIPTALLHSGAGGTYCWASDGSRMFLESSINIELKMLLKNELSLRSALQELTQQGLVSPHSVEDSWIVTPYHRVERVNSLEPELCRRWRLEALRLVFSAIPMKNVNDGNPRLNKVMLKKHIQHTLISIKIEDGYGRIPSDLRPAVANGLLESSFYPGRTWKEFSIQEAEGLIASIPNTDPYLRISLRHRQSLLDRKLPQTDAHELRPSAQRITHSQLLNPSNRRENALMGRDRHQDALHYFQEEQLSRAIEMLNQWQPLQPLSLMEVVVCCELNLFRGKILRFQGQLEESQKCLETVYETMSRHPQLSWGEMSGAVALQMADTMFCLKKYEEAKKQAEFVLRNRQYSLDFHAISLVILAECFMFQNKWYEAENCLLDARKECNAAAGRTRNVTGESAGDESSDKLVGLSKETALRFHISTAKLAHLQRQWDRALEGWVKAIETVNKIPPTSGHAAKVLHLSQQKVLEQLRQPELAARSADNINVLEQVSKHSEATHWIPGLDVWEQYLKQ